MSFADFTIYLVVFGIGVLLFGGLVQAFVFVLVLEVICRITLAMRYGL